MYYFYDAGQNVIGAYSQSINIVMQALQQQLFTPAQLLATSQNISCRGNILTIPLKQIINSNLKSYIMQEGTISTNVASGNALLKEAWKSVPRNRYSICSQTIQDQLSL